MAVGPNFQDSETQAAIAAQSGQPVDPVEPAATEATGVEETETTDSTPEATPTEAAASETPSAEESKTEESAATVNMEELRKMDEEQINAELAKVGFTQEDLGQELGDNDGKLTDATREKLIKHFGEEAVTAAITDLEKQYAEAKPKAVKEAADKVQKMNEYIMGKLAGGDLEKGQANFKELSAWAQKNLDARQLKLINKKLASGDQDLVDEALEQAVGAWKKGRRPTMMTGDAAADSKPVPEFKPLSKDEFIKIMGTEKYQSDLEYAAQIDARRRKTMENEGATTPEFSHLRPPV